MLFVLLAVHNAEVCPTSNAKVRDLMMEMSPQIPGIAERTNVKIVAGPYVSREHLTVIAAEADRAEDIDRFLVESRLQQWNTIRVVPSQPMDEVMRDLEEGESLF